MTQSLTRTQARDEVFGLLKTAIDTNAAGTLVFYEDDGQRTPDATEDTDFEVKPWVRAFIRHVAGNQRTFGETGNRRFERLCVITVQVFTSRGKGLSESDILSKVVADAFEGERTTNGIWFRDVVANEAEPSGAWFQVNVSANFTYDELK